MRIERDADRHGGRRPVRRIVVAACVALALPGAATADEADALNAFVSQSVAYDDNLYRLPDDAAAPEGTRHDTVTTTSAGLAFDRTYSRQRLRAGLQLSARRHRVHDDLDHDSPAARLLWDWQLGRHWSGLFNHEYRETPAGFDDVRGTQRSINVYTRSAATANYRWHPAWAIGLGLARISSEYSDGTQPGSEYDARETDLNLSYRPASGNRIGLTLRDTEGRFPNRPATPGSIRDYRQREVRLDGHWQATGALLLSGYVGQVSRAYDRAPNRDFDGTIGRLDLAWQPTGKTTIKLNLRREIGADQDLVANYAVTEAAGVAPQWEITDKLRLGGLLEARRRDYGGDPDLGFDGIVPVRGDTTYRYGLDLRYRPIRALSFLLSIRHQRRDASEGLREYRANLASLLARFEF